MSDRALATRLNALFSGSATAHGTHGEPEQQEGNLKWNIKRTARTLREPVTINLWMEHLKGNYPLGVIPIKEDSLCAWGSIDYDVYDTTLIELLRKAEKAKIPLVPCRSKSGGLHLFVFLDEAIPAATVSEALRDVAASLGIGGSEIFPKQKKILTEKGDFGNWMVMPYFGTTYGGKLSEQVGLRWTGAELTLEEFLRYAEGRKTTLSQLESVLSSRRGVALKGGDTRKPFGDGPPCLQHLAGEKIGNGGQNNALFMMGVYYKRADPAGWKERLETANREYLDPPGNSEGMTQIIRSLEKKEYEYTCNTEPMASHCDMRACRGRRHGIGAWGEYPEISGLSVMKSEPVIWFLDVDGERLEIGTDDLSNYARFLKICMERLQKCYRMMKQDTWLQLLHTAMENVVTIEVSADAVRGATLHEQLEEFLTNRQTGNRVEDLLSARPWENEERNRFEFRLKDLQKFLRKEGHDAITRGQLTQEIKRIGGGHSAANIKGKCVNYWYVPIDKFERTPSIDPPPVLFNGHGTDDRDVM